MQGFLDTWTGGGGKCRGGTLLFGSHVVDVGRGFSRFFGCQFNTLAIGLGILIITLLIRNLQSTTHLKPLSISISKTTPPPKIRDTYPFSLLAPWFRIQLDLLKNILYNPIEISLRSFMNGTPIQVEEEHSFIVEGGGTDVDGSAIGEDLVFFEIFEVGFIFFLS